MINNIFEYIYKSVFDTNQINDGIANVTSNTKINTKNISNSISIKNNQFASKDKKSFVNAKEHYCIDNINKSNKCITNTYNNIKTNPNDHHINKSNISKSNNISIKNNKSASIDKKDYVNAKEHCNINSISKSNKSSKNIYKNKTNPNDHCINKPNINKNVSMHININNKKKNKAILEHSLKLGHKEYLIIIQTEDFKSALADHINDIDVLFEVEKKKKEAIVDRVRAEVQEIIKLDHEDFIIKYRSEEFGCILSMLGEDMYYEKHYDDIIIILKERWDQVHKYLEWKELEEERKEYNLEDREMVDKMVLLGHREFALKFNSDKFDEIYYRLDDDSIEKLDARWDEYFMWSTSTKSIDSKSSNQNNIGNKLTICKVSIEDDALRKQDNETLVNKLNKLYVEEDCSDYDDVSSYIYNRNNSNDFDYKSESKALGTSKTIDNDIINYDSEDDYNYNYTRNYKYIDNVINLEHNNNLNYNLDDIPKHILSHNTEYIDSDDDTEYGESDNIVNDNPDDDHNNHVLISTHKFIRKDGVNINDIDYIESYGSDKENDNNTIINSNMENNNINAENNIIIYITHNINDNNTEINYNIDNSIPNILNDNTNIKNYINIHNIDELQNIENSKTLLILMISSFLFIIILLL